MRILVLQLARFGDIFQTWPTLKALQRQHPDCDVHVLVRERFRSALDGFEGITVHSFSTAHILEPIMNDGDVDAAHARLLSHLAPLHGFDRILNLSFSPMSSYLVDLLSGSTTEVRGYTRAGDGHLRIADDTSAYFYAQVGIGRANRYHVIDLFAAVAGVELTSEDFCLNPRAPSERSGIVVHLGASQAEKAYSPEDWVRALKPLSETKAGDICLIGSKAERSMSEAVAAQIGSSRLQNWVGNTSWVETHERIASAQLLIGADSAPIHLATLSNTPTLNLSAGSVNFWETGPLAQGSRVLFCEKISQLPAQQVCEEALALLQDLPPRHAQAVCREWRGPLESLKDTENEFTWKLIQALYTDANYPAVEKEEDRLTFQRYNELAELAIQQLERWDGVQDKTTCAKILAQVDELLVDLGRINPRTEPVLQWFQTQRVRIPPGSAAEILQHTLEAFRELLVVTSVYGRKDFRKIVIDAAELCQRCYPELRECNLSSVHGDFQLFVSLLHELARSSTKVVKRSWASLLQELNASLERRDYLQVADILQWELLPALRHQTETLSQDVLS